MRLLFNSSSSLILFRHAPLTFCVCVCVCRLELLLQRANKIQNMALDCEEKLTLAKNTLQAVSADPLIFYLAFISSEAPTQGLG